MTQSTNYYFRMAEKNKYDELYVRHCIAAHKNIALLLLSINYMHDYCCGWNSRGCGWWFFYSHSKKTVCSGKWVPVPLEPIVVCATVMISPPRLFYPSTFWTFSIHVPLMSNAREKKMNFISNLILHQTQTTFKLNYRKTLWNLLSGNFLILLDEWTQPKYLLHIQIRAVRFFSSLPLVWVNEMFLLAVNIYV